MLSRIVLTLPLLFLVVKGHDSPFTILSKATNASSSSGEAAASSTGSVGSVSSTGIDSTASGNPTAMGGGGPVVDLPTLVNVQVLGATMSPAFAASTKDYTITVTSNQIQVTWVIPQNTTAWVRTFDINDWWPFVCISGGVDIGQPDCSVVYTRPIQAGEASFVVDVILMDEYNISITDEYTFSIIPPFLSGAKTVNQISLVTLLVDNYFDSQATRLKVVETVMAAVGITDAQVQQNVIVWYAAPPIVVRGPVNVTIGFIGEQSAAVAVKTEWLNLIEGSTSLLTDLSSNNPDKFAIDASFTPSASTVNNFNTNVETVSKGAIYFCGDGSHTAMPITCNNTYIPPAPIGNNYNLQPWAIQPVCYECCEVCTPAGESQPSSATQLTSAAGIVGMLVTLLIASWAK